MPGWPRRFQGAPGVGFGRKAKKKPGRKIPGKPGRNIPGKLGRKTRETGPTNSGVPSEKTSRWLLAWLFSWERPLGGSQWVADRFAWGWQYPYLAVFTGYLKAVWPEIFRPACPSRPPEPSQIAGARPTREFARQIGPADQVEGHFATNEKSRQTAFKYPI